MITIELDKIRVLRFNRKALKMLENTFKTKVMKINFDDLSTDDMTKIIHIALQHEDSALTLEQTEELVDRYPYFGILVKKSMDAFALAMMGPKEDKKDVEVLEEKK